MSWSKDARQLSSHQVHLTQSVFRDEKRLTARFTICDLLSFPVNIDCLFLSFRIKIGAVDPVKTFHQLRACTIDILEVISSFSWISRFVSRPQRNISALNQLGIWELCDQLAILGMSGLWLFLIAPSGAIWRLDKNPSVCQSVSSSTWFRKSWAT